MTIKPWKLIALAVVLGGLSLYLNKDWFAGENIHIFHRSRASFFRRTKAPANAAANQVFFRLDRKLKLTSLKVISVSELATNRFPHPIWELVTESNSVPTDEFVYGSHIRGMHPAVPGATPDPLVPGVTNRLLIEAGNLKAQHDFVPVARTQ